MIRLSEEKPISVAIMAMGGQGGGVLADWIVALAESSGWVAQSTSVPGVAQRTGATIYYVEMIRPQRNHAPVLSLMPVPGDVDVVIAAELMEAGRAIQRGLVSPGKTTLIASSHRSLAMTEKMAPGDGIADVSPVVATAHAVSKRFVAADMQRIAESRGSVISSALFGALAGSGVLPFGREAFEATIRASGVGVEGSLRAFGGGFEAVEVAPSELSVEAPELEVSGGSSGEQAELARALLRVTNEFAAPARGMLRVGLARVVDYQDVAYAHDYLDRVGRLAGIGDAVVTEAARQVAVAMAYDDVIRVADLKTRGSRFARVQREVLAGPAQIVETTEFMHPRVAEMMATMPVRLGLAFERSVALQGVLRRLFEHGRRVRTTHVLGFLSLYAIAGLRRWRRGLLRHGREMAHLDGWLGLVERHGDDPRLALELVKCRRLVKGYSDTHARGQSKFDRVIGAMGMLAGRADAADWIRRLRDAALADVDGRMLDGALATVATL